MYWQSVRDLQNDLYRLGNFIRINGHRNRCPHVGIGSQIRRQKTKITVILFHQSRKLELFAIFSRYTGQIIHFHDERHPTVFGGRKCNRNIKARRVRINVHCQSGFAEPGGGQLRCRVLLFTSYQCHACKKGGQYTFSAHKFIKFQWVITSLFATSGTTRCENQASIKSCPIIIRIRHCNHKYRQ